MIHQCVSENNWFTSMLSIPVDSPLPPVESRRGFIERYGEDSHRRLEALRGKEDGS